MCQKLKITEESSHKQRNLHSYEGIMFNTTRKNISLHIKYFAKYGAMQDKKVYWFLSLGAFSQIYSRDCEIRVI